MDFLRRLRPARLETAAAAGIELVLRERFPLRLTAARGGRLVCTEGCAWVTVPGVAADIILYRGDAWEVCSNETVLLEAIGCATVALRVGSTQLTAPAT